MRAGENTVSPVQPAVRPPFQPVDDVVPHTVIVETVEHHLRLCVRHVVTVPVGDKQDIGSAGGPNTTEPKHD